jgi:hypothetical protein
VRAGLEPDAVRERLNDRRRRIATCEGSCSVGRWDAASCPTWPILEAKHLTAPMSLGAAPDSFGALGVTAPASRQESVVRSVGLEELDLQLCAGFLAALGEVPQVAAQVASKVHRGNGPRQARWLHRPTGRALGRRRTTAGIATILFEAKQRGIMHSSSQLTFSEALLVRPAEGGQ